jgi:hypothetical protein
MTAAITITRIDGLAVAAAPADLIRPALRGAQPLTLNCGKVAGDVIYLAPRIEQVWRNDAITIDTGDLARTIDHPEHGEVLVAYVDMNRLDGAPRLAAIEAARATRMAADYQATQDRADRMVPACDNCGDCARCC